MNKDPQKPSPTGLRDGAGHLKARVAREVEAHSHEEGSGDRAFFRGARTSDPLAEQLGESFVATATGSEDDREQALEDLEADERGGPFVETAGETEFASGTDASNPKDATREPFPLT